MFANKDKNQSVTIGDFQEFADMLLSHFASKEDLKNLVTKDEHRKSIDEVLNSNDKLVKKLDTFMTEKVVLGGQVKEQWEEVDKLKNRVATIEKHVGIEPVLAVH